MSRHIDKEALVTAIKQSQELSDEQKSDIIGLIRTEKSYGLVWEDSKEDAYEILKTKVPILREVKDKRILNDSKDEYHPNHIIIEADNLHALTALSYSHASEFDVLYFDPPYNTGKDNEFKYNDKWVNSEDEYRHSKWISFMSKRLRIAKQLMKESGIIFISIDDNEIAQLRCLCDEIFNSTSNPKQSNCLGILIWDLGTGTQAGHFTRAHEYVLAYAKNKENVKNFSGGDGIIDHSALKKISKKNPPVEFVFKAGTKFLAEDGVELTGIWGEAEKTELVEGRMVCENNQLKYDVTLKAGFAMINQMRSWFDGKFTIDSKGQHVIDFYFNKSGVLHYIKDKSIINPPTIITEVGSTKQGTTELTNIVGSADAFDYPKPTSLIQFLLNLQGKNIKVLDIFAGSGTTMHATMQLNAEDGGHRQCILVTNNENNICEEVTYERNKRVIEGYTTPKGEHVEGLKNNNLRYYKVELTEREQSHQQNKKLVNDLKDLLCIKENIYQEVKTFGALSLVGKEQMLRCFAEGERQMLMVYDSRVIPYLVKEIERLTQKTKIYLFADGAYPYTEDFRTVLDKVDLVPLPYAYQRAIKYALPDADPAWKDDTDLTEDEQQAMMAEAIEAENNEMKKEG